MCREFKKGSETIVSAVRPYNPKRIFIFGSFAGKNWDEEISDIDIAVEGIEMDKLGLVDWSIAEVFEGRQFDLVPLEYASPALKRSIELTGRV